jgi:hypothetical protein
VPLVRADGTTPVVQQPPTALADVGLRGRLDARALPEGGQEAGDDPLLSADHHGVPGDRLPQVVGRRTFVPGEPCPGQARLTTDRDSAGRGERRQGLRACREIGAEQAGDTEAGKNRDQGCRLLPAGLAELGRNRVPLQPVRRGRGRRVPDQQQRLGVARRAGEQVERT